MKVAYLINQYPKTSHSWIRREIAAVESEGIEVHRYSCRQVQEPLVDPGDFQEQKVTRTLLSGGAFGLAFALLAVLITRPLCFLAAARLTWSMGWRSSRGMPVHFAYLAEACVLLRCFRGDPVDHVHAHFGTNSASVACLCAELGGPSFSFTFHGPEMFEYPNFPSLTEKIHRSRFCCCISHNGRSHLYRWSDPRFWDKIELMRCGVDEVFLKDEEHPIPETNRIVCVARLSPVKGHLLLLDSCKELVDEGFDPEILLVGDGDFRAEVERRAQELGLQERVIFGGWMSGVQVREAILSSRGMVLPSFDEGLPVVFMESYALWRPVLSTYIAGIPELVEPGNNGWLVPAGSSQELTDALRELYQKPVSELSEMGRRGAERVRFQHDSKKEGRRLAGFFKGYHSQQVPELDAQASSDKKRAA
ncbi:MAG: colanic acid/amylovoran biosynthesis glycosyltransferase [Planctomycetota bacterium]|jgi:colanic acid/amylovoran biosynthesis glycosyltransferase